MSRLRTHDYDVIVIGAGGAGLRAAIEAKQRGLRTALVCKSLLGKAHTVMAEGGVAAAMGNVYAEDNWKVHFRDTMRGGKMLNNWRMAELHAKESPDRVRELEAWGALFDRTKDGRILQRDFGGHRYARLAHVGDRTGLELIRTLQQKAVAATSTSSWSARSSASSHDADGTVAGHGRLLAPTGEFVIFEAKSVVLATGGVGKSWKYTSNSWESTGDGHAMALWAGADLIDMECVQFHPTGMVWPLSVRGILVTEGVRGDGGVLRNSEGKRFMFDYVADMFRAETADSEDEADRWYDDHTAGRRPPELLPRDEVARSINSEVKAGRGSPHGGVFLDIATRRTAEDIRRRLPSMYHQFMELAGVDITAEAMEVGPTCHYIMGGVRVDADTDGRHRARALRRRRGGRRHARLQPARRQLALGPPGLRAPCRHGRLRLRRGPHRRRSTLDEGQIQEAIDEALAPFEPRGRARTPTTSSTTCRRPCRAWSASSAPAPSSTRPSRSSRCSRSGPHGCRSSGGTSLQPGLEPRHRPALDAHGVDAAWPSARSTARRAEAARPATTSPRPTPRSARSTSSAIASPSAAPAASAARRRCGRSRQPEPLPVMPDDLKALLEEAN